MCPLPPPKRACSAEQSSEKKAGRIVQPYLTESVYIVGFQKSIPAQIRQLVLDISHIEGYVDGCVRELTSAKRLYEPFL